MRTYAILKLSLDGPDLWATDLTWDEARDEAEKATAEFGGKYRIVEQPANPLDLIPDCRA